MHLLIKDMEMPQSCWRCPLCLTVDPDTYRCMPTGQDFESSFDAIDHIVLSCPLVELPPHGRLIDADKFVEEARKEYADCWNNGPTGSWMGWHDAAIRAENAPTIIEAEVKE